jgi:ectoine hydroxylase-related dioxygenase (phytanoyl-CoA dioxygenase family)
MEEKYHKTFTVDQEDKIKEYFLENGYVAIRDILTEDDCTNTLKEMNQQMHELDPTFDMNNPDTYGQAPILNNYGMYAKLPIFSKQFLLNRQNEKLHRAFSILYNDDKLLVNHDRCAFYLPTKNVLINGNQIDKPEWKTHYVFPGLHLDFHPIAYNDDNKIIEKREMFNYADTRDFVGENNLYSAQDGLMIQGIINLKDNYDEDGGFQCVPEFPSKFNDWCNDRKFEGYEEGVYHFSNTNKTDMKYCSNPIRVPVPKGAIILWSQLMAHGTKPNNSNQGRCIQFIKMFPKKILTKQRLKHRSATLKRIFKNIEFVPSKLGRTVFNV